MRILVTGGCGYKGSVLVPMLLKEGHEVIVVDNRWFGNHLKDHRRLTNIKMDIRNYDSIPLKKIQAIIHLANIANDPAVDLNPTLSWEVNVLAGQQLIDRACRQGVNHFMFASSGSVYGLKDEDKVTEDLSLIPISTYNKTKMIAERVFLSYSDQIKVHCIRPATVCGLSPRMRLDVAVNLLTFQALKNKKITVLGGDQTRPNIHIEDICRVYLHLLNNSRVIDSGCFNAGFENVSIMEIAKMIHQKIECEIEIKPSNDPRSYRQDSTKLINTGFIPKKNISNAIDELIDSYTNNELKDDPSFYTVNWMKQKSFI